MSKPILLLWVFMLFNILTYGSTSNAGAGDFSTSKPQKEPKPLYAMIMESSKPGIQRTSPGLHVVQQTSISRLAKSSYTGPKTINKPRKGRRSASCSIKPPSLFLAALNYLIFGLLLVTCFF